MVTARPHSTPAAPLPHPAGGFLMHRISESLRTSQPHQWMLASLIAAGAILRLIAMLPGGYALDEEITQFAVDGIREHWLPLFPSGALNDRAVPYSYAAWIAGSLFGDGLPSYRLVSLVSGVMAVLLTYAAARRVATASVALAATLLLVLFLPHVEASVWARSVQPHDDRLPWRARCLSARRSRQFQHRSLSRSLCRECLLA